ncbi:Hypothetical_protein [Hexamita inflata]|uniref:Hypothetical_protein n=1 Tax=Hexamita inflata TaxID=28002 RepID=A0AA86UGE0_9EUKA|nr:Hypothetical protein HINF_LOCUS27108 [Hexamita inflata]
MCLQRLFQRKTLYLQQRSLEINAEAQYKDCQKQVSRDGPHSAFQLLLYCLVARCTLVGYHHRFVCVPDFTIQTFVTQSVANQLADYILLVLLSRFILITLQNANVARYEITWWIVPDADYYVTIFN